MGTARRRVFERETTPVYHHIPVASTAKSGLPLLVNTAFRVQEAPIIKTSEEYAQSLAEVRIDHVETGAYGVGGGRPMRRTAELTPSVWIISGTKLRHLTT